MKRSDTEDPHREGGCQHAGRCSPEGEGQQAAPLRRAAVVVVCTAAVIALCIACSRRTTAVHSLAAMGSNHSLAAGGGGAGGSRNSTQAWPRRPPVAWAEALAAAHNNTHGANISAVELKAVLDVQMERWSRTKELDPAVCSRPPFTGGFQTEVFSTGRSLTLEPIVVFPLSWWCRKRKTTKIRGKPCRGARGRIVQCPGAGERPGCVLHAHPGWPRATSLEHRRLMLAQNLLQLQCTVPLPVVRPEVARAPRRVYIDLGAREPPGAGRPHFDWGAMALPEARGLAPRYPLEFNEVHAFEMSHRWADRWNESLDAMRQRGAKVHFYHAAAAVADGEVRYSYDPSNPDSMGKLLTEGECKTAPGCRTVPAVDMARWMREVLRAEDFVVLKMDVEGYEYRLIPHLFDHGLLHALVDELYLEMHSDDSHSFLKSTDPGAVRMCKSQECAATFVTALRQQGLAAHSWM
eukprot:Hpha_TRINITY_DN23619_c0_g1::TRINITY_DN23619_c0_g1_i1::g.57482::m.57482